MKKFVTLNGPVAPLQLINIDTDQIIPKQYLSAISRAGLGKGLFHDFRYKPNGQEKGDFILNLKPYRNAKILLAGDNFGCGSSREHAPWALDDFGIRCVIAPGFADIFFNNCVKNGILLINMPETQVTELAGLAANPDSCVMSVDLKEQNITTKNGLQIGFDIETFRKHRLLNGLDDIEITLQKEADIKIFESKQKQAMPWLYRETSRINSG